MASTASDFLLDFDARQISNDAKKCGFWKAFKLLLRFSVQKVFDVLGMFEVFIESLPSTRPWGSGYARY